MRQTGHWTHRGALSEEAFRSILAQVINSLDVKQARDEVQPFVKDPGSLAVWSHEFFWEVSKRIIVV